MNIFAVQRRQSIVSAVDAPYKSAAVADDQHAVGDPEDTIFAAKNRQPGHNIWIIGTYRQHREIHVRPECKFEMARILAEDSGMMGGIIAKFDTQTLHPRLAKLAPVTLSHITHGGATWSASRFRKSRSYENSAGSVMPIRAGC